MLKMKKKVYVGGRESKQLPSWRGDMNKDCKCPIVMSIQVKQLFVHLEDELINDYLNGLWCIRTSKVNCLLINFPSSRLNVQM